MNLQKFKEKRGITLIALVVTIIVLLILAGISISMLTGQNGILNRASEAKESTGAAQTEELVKISVTDAITQGLGSLTDANLKTALDNNIGAGKYEISGNETNGWIVKVNGKEYGIDSTGNISKTPTGGDTGKLPTGEGTTPYLPDEGKFKQVEGTDLSTGLVIEEKATGSQYVWVEVPKTAAVYPTAGANITSFSDDEYGRIEADLHTYTNAYRSKDCSDVYYSDSTTGWFTETGDTSYDNAKKKMLKSVYSNGGFWVGRYEAGIEVNRTAKGDATTTPLSKENLYPYTYVTRTQAKVLAEQVESGSYTSSLMFGVQWDLVLKYIETKKATTQYNLRTDSLTIGNYYTSEFSLNRGKFAQYEALSSWYNFNSDDKTDLVEGSRKKTQSSSSNAILLTTGATEATNLKNIYDIAGNVGEWTLENCTDGNPFCINRGGSFKDRYSYFPACCRLCTTPWDSNNSVGFRLSLY